MRQNEIPMGNAAILSILVGEVAAQALCQAFPSLSELARASDGYPR